MGRIRYDTETTVELDDTTVSHLQSVIEAKLRRGEPFTMAWPVDASRGGGRIAVWLSRSSHLTFSYSSERPRVEQEPFRRMMDAANSAAGLVVPSDRPRSDEDQPH